MLTSCKKYIPAVLTVIALVLATLTANAQAVFAESTKTITTTVNKVFSLATSEGKDTTAIETDQGTFLLPSDMSVPETNTLIKLNADSSDNVLSWREVTETEYLTETKQSTDKTTKTKKKTKAKHTEESEHIKLVQIILVSIAGAAGFIAILACLMGEPEAFPAFVIAVITFGLAVILEY